MSPMLIIFKPAYSWAILSAENMVVDLYDRTCTRHWVSSDYFLKLLFVSFEQIFKF